MVAERSDERADRAPEAPLPHAVADPLTARLTALAAPVVEAADVELVALEVKGPSGRRVVRLVLDADHGVDVDRCAGISRAVGARFDDADAIDGGYTLEVSSLGVHRPLRTERDFTRNLGRHLRLVRRDGTEVTGTLTAIAADALTLDIDGAATNVARDDVEYGRVVLPW